MDKKILVFANIITLLATIIINYLSNTGIFNGNTASTVSHQYKNLFTPAGYAFSIWGIIYIGLIGFIVYQSKVFVKTESEKVYEEEEIVYEIGWLFAFSCLINCIWILTWLYDLIGISVVVMIVLLFTLFRIIVKTGMELQSASFKKIALVWWPFSIYTGWVTVALLANIAAYLTKLGWAGFTTQIHWTLIFIFIAAVINLYMTWFRNMREYAIAGAWGILAIGVANWSTESVIALTSLAVTLLLLFSSGLHAYKNQFINK